MTPDQWKLVNEIFDEATAIAVDRRAAFLEDRCAGKDEIRKEVESLLRFRRDEDSLFSNEPAKKLPKIEVTDFTNWAARCLGRYSLKSLLSAGGMGVVFLAEQDNPRRDVAIKLLHRGLLFGGAGRRFEYEAQILGRLKHPCIAEIYEAGCAILAPVPENGPTAPLHFFAMEYVEGGKTLTDFAQLNNLDIEDRLRLFTRICDGVHHGHQKGVIHRDLKPTNILVTMVQRSGEGLTPLPKIIDFGVAKCTDGDIAATTMQTSAGDLIGTLQYMSPEQCGTDSLAIDIRADVYALGVVLYELLTGHVPYDVSNLTIQAAVRMISETPPTSASIFNRNLRGDLEVIINKALEKDREKRYGSAAELADDIQRYLKGEAIEARPPTRWERSMRWVIRHPRWAAAVGSAMISLTIIAFTYMSIWYLKYQPDRLELTRFGSLYHQESGFRAESGDRATLYAISGDILRRWEADNDGIRIAALLDRPIKWGGGKLAVVGFNEYPENPNLRNRICIYDANNPIEAWNTIEFRAEFLNGMEDHDWPRPKEEQHRTYSTSDFFLSRAWTINVFDDADFPGYEIVSYFQHSRGSQGLLLISDLRGTPLYYVWQDGGINDVHWMPNSTILICAALRADHDDSGYGIDLQGSHPIVLFSIKPKIYEFNNSWILPYQPDPNELSRYSGDRWRGKMYKTNWYKAICPAKYSPVGKVNVYLVPSLYGQSKKQARIDVSFHFNGIPDAAGNPYSIELGIDNEGEIVDQPVQNNSARAAYDKNPTLPSPNEIRFIEWKGVKYPCQ